MAVCPSTIYSPLRLTLVCIWVGSSDGDWRKNGSESGQACGHWDPPSHAWPGSMAQHQSGMATHAGRVASGTDWHGVDFPAILAGGKTSPTPTEGGVPIMAMMGDMMGPSAPRCLSGSGAPPVHTVRARRSRVSRLSQPRGTKFPRLPPIRPGRSAIGHGLSRGPHAGSYLG